MRYGCLGISSTYGMDTVFCSSLLFFACPVWRERISVRIPGRWCTGHCLGLCMWLSRTENNHMGHLDGDISWNLKRKLLEKWMVK